MSGQLRTLPTRLTAEVGTVAVVGAVAAVALQAAVPTTVTEAGVVDPVLVVVGCWLGGLGYLVANIDENCVPGGGMVRTLGLANGLTLFRGWLFGVVAGFVVVPAGTALAWVPAACYGVGVAVDAIDGAIARTVGRETALGRRLDMAVDTFGFLAAPLVAVSWGLLPVYYLSLSVARHVYKGGLAWRRRQGKRIHDQPNDDLSRYLAAAQMLFLTVVLVPGSPTGLLRAVAPVALACSLLVFCRDYLVVTGRLGRWAQLS